MIATLQFTLPEEIEEFDLATNAAKYQSALWEIKNRIRSIWKYEDLEGKDPQELIDRVYQIICDEIFDRGLSDEF